jgi:hypothetical protein
LSLKKLYPCPVTQLHTEHIQLLQLHPDVAIAKVRLCIPYATAAIIRSAYTATSSYADTSNGSLKYTSKGPVSLLYVFAAATSLYNYCNSISMLLLQLYCKFIPTATNSTLKPYIQCCGSRSGRIRTFLVGSGSEVWDRIRTLSLHHNCYVILMPIR